MRHLDELAAAPAHEVVDDEQVGVAEQAEDGLHPDVLQRLRNRFICLHAGFPPHDNRIAAALPAAPAGGRPGLTDHCGWKPLSEMMRAHTRV